MKQEKFEKYKSTYLETGFKDDEFSIADFAINDEKTECTAIVNIDKYFPDQGDFHLSSITASRITQQLLVIYTFMYLNRPKDIETFALEEIWKYKGIISNPNAIIFKFTNINVRKIKNINFFLTDFSIGDDNFKGKIKWCVNLQQ